MTDKKMNIFKRLFRSYKNLEEEDYVAETGESVEEFDRERLWMELRNWLVLAAAVLFFISLFISGSHRLRAIAYFLGAGAYFSELAMLTDGFRHAIPRREAFMALCFGPLYVLMGLSYLLG